MGFVVLTVNFFVALFALLDPVGSLPVFAAATSGDTPAQRRLVALYIALFTIVFLAVFYFTGLSLLKFFGISLAAFRIAGGVLLMLLGLSMAREDFVGQFAHEPEDGAVPNDLRGYARRRFEGMIVPFAMPLLIGPGAISAVIIQAGEAAPFGLAGVAAGLLAIIGAGLSVLIAFALAAPISRALGRVGMAIVVRVLGLILCAMAVQFMIVGVSEATHGLIVPGVARPYPNG